MSNITLKAKRLVPYKLKRAIRLFQSGRIDRHLQSSTSFCEIGEAGPLIKNVFEPLKQVPGWFNVDDCGHFHLILSLQSFWGMGGNLFEIGSYHGRSAAVMSRYLAPGEKIIVCDPFTGSTGADDNPSAENLIKNILLVNRSLDKSRIVVHQCFSNELDLSAEDKFRFIHIDGGHSAQQTFFDLTLCKKHIIDQGIVVVDDYHNKIFPGVADGVDSFLSENTDMQILADLNRHGAYGRKLYLVKLPGHS